MSGSNKIMIAAAGSGKTTFLVKEALQVKNSRVLITTFTDSNAEEIRAKFYELNNGSIPPNITVMNWFTFLINHGVKPFQGGEFEFSLKGMLLVSNKSGLKYKNKAGQPIFWGEEDFEEYYFTSDHRIYSDKLSKLVCRCNKKSGGNVVDRISRIFSHIFIDEVQDMAGYDLDIISLLFQSSVNVLLVGDPRQVTYLTHNEAKYKQYSGGGILSFLQDKLPKKVTFSQDEITLKASHRNNEEICAYSSKLYPNFQASTPCNCKQCREVVLEDAGLYIVRPEDYRSYLEKFKPIQLRWSTDSAGVDKEFPAMNFGLSKGLGFERVVILPTTEMQSWIKNNDHGLAVSTRAKFYVALTRARHSVAIMAKFKDHEIPTGFKVYKPI